MIFIPARIDADRARRFFARRRWGNLFGLVGRMDGAGLHLAGDGCGMPCIERVWIPHYQVDFEVNSIKGPGVVSVSVEGCSKSFAIFQMHDNLLEGEMEEPCLPVLAPEGDAVLHGRRELLKAIMRRRGQQGKPVIGEMRGASLFYYPFWVVYFKRRGRYIDIRLQDALTGERGGNRTKQGVLNAFVAMRGAKKS